MANKSEEILAKYQFEVRSLDTLARQAGRALALEPPEVGHSQVSTIGAWLDRIIYRRVDVSRLSFDVLSRKLASRTNSLVDRIAADVMATESLGDAESRAKIGMDVVILLNRRLSLAVDESMMSEIEQRGKGGRGFTSS